ncbi:MAG TPA: DUF47 family protein [Actinomycetota bacterium]|nr:DUF47 family protein [Actinomycetota bacterium]
MTRRSWFLPETPDVLGMLRGQAAVTIEGVEALVSWGEGDPGGADLVRECEHRADDRKRELRRALTEAYTTPIDAEDVYTMSVRLDAVMNGAKDAVREAEVMGMAPDEHVREMCQLLAEGVRHLADAFGRLGPERRVAADGRTATDAADEAVKSQRNLERVYRGAMSALLEVDDLREVMGRRELYRRFSRVSEDLVEVAERVWYATFKEG